YIPFYYRANSIDGSINLTALNDGTAGSVGQTGREYLDYSAGNKDQVNTYYTEVAANYAQKFNEKHDVSAMLIGIIQNTIVSYSNNESLEMSLPRKNLGLSGRFSYNYDTRYLVEFNFGYNGSERFAERNRWGFFPSIGGAWVIANESFFSGLKKYITNLK